MLYISYIDYKRNKFGVTDTDDGKTEYCTSQELRKAVVSSGLRIEGVDVSARKFWVVNPATLKPKTRQDFLEENVGYDYILETRESYDFTQFVVSIGGDTLIYRVYGNNGDFKIYQK